MEEQPIGIAGHPLQNTALVLQKNGNVQISIPDICEDQKIPRKKKGKDQPDIFHTNFLNLQKQVENL